MTFDEWWEKVGAEIGFCGEPNAAFEAWEAATAAERERCAKLCDQQTNDDTEWANAAAFCAAAIRETP